MENLNQKILDLPSSLVVETIKNLRLSLQYESGLEVSDNDVKQTLQNLEADGEVDDLRHAIINETSDLAQIERWGKSLLILLADDPELQPQIDEAIEDARTSGVKDMGISTLIVLGALIVILKYRPKKFTRTKNDLKIEWAENDVGIVSKLASLIFGPPTS